MVTRSTRLVWMIEDMLFSLCFRTSGISGSMGSRSHRSGCSSGGLSNSHAFIFGSSFQIQNLARPMPSPFFGPRARWMPLRLACRCSVGSDPMRRTRWFCCIVWVRVLAVSLLVSVLRLFWLCASGGIFRQF